MLRWKIPAAIAAMLMVVTLGSPPASADDWNVQGYDDERWQTWDYCVWDCSPAYFPYWRPLGGPQMVQLMMNTWITYENEIHCPNPYYYWTDTYLHFSWTDYGAYYLDYIEISSALPQLAWINVATSNGWYDTVTEVGYHRWRVNMPPQQGYSNIRVHFEMVNGSIPGMGSLCPQGYNYVFVEGDLPWG
jgi:hypothetical protein